jgi:hypothetical protein
MYPAQFPLAVSTAVSFLSRPLVLAAHAHISRKRRPAGLPPRVLLPSRA